MLSLTNLGNMFEPSAKTDEYKQHRRCIKESKRARWLADPHGCQQYGTGVYIRDPRSHRYKYVHVGSTVLQGIQSLHVEVVTSVKLKKKKKNEYIHLQLVFFSSNIYTDLLQHMYKQPSF